MHVDVPCAATASERMAPMSTWDPATSAAHLALHPTSYLSSEQSTSTEEQGSKTELKNSLFLYNNQNKKFLLQRIGWPASLILYSPPKSHLTRKQAVSSLVFFFPCKKSSCQRCPRQWAVLFVFHSPTSSRAFSLLPIPPRLHTAVLTSVQILAALCPLWG